MAIEPFNELSVADECRRGWLAIRDINPDVMVLNMGRPYFFCGCPRCYRLKRSGIQQKPFAGYLFLLICDGVDAKERSRFAFQ